MDFLWKSPDYQLLSVEDDEKSTLVLTRDLPNKSRKNSWRFYLLTLLPWVLTLFFASVALVEHLSRTQVSSLGSYSTGWKTDFAAARPHIKIEQVRFNGGTAFDDDGKAFIPHPEPIDYEGDGPKVDQAWDELTGGRYVRITEEEAHEAWGEDISPFWERRAESYVAGFDMFHSLHCLNRIRQLTPEDLIRIKTNHNDLAHHKHCLSQIRQYIMCSGDMSVVPTRYYPGIEHNYIDSDVFHTCRKFEDLRSWVWERYNGSLAVPAMGQRAQT
ncbi:hypothetical protein L207DRAFT_415190 [Hyaloscypha variabilis F]|uniref:Tat pathway signal sequence n=1 Tax=Hyaloscypha variabilis (strain UAMH 11265 / GT02V1 / F) TaxID=1149755 RepID=A0A2J6SDP6_HYAVF|nr:hypothetical protein L207DRAFT_415190 [Hyaloscypha variabilis F]